MTLLPRRSASPATRIIAGLRRVALAAATAAGLLVGSATTGDAQGQLRRIDNRAEVTYEDANGNQGSADAAATIFVSIASEVRVSPDYNVVARAGERRVLLHWVTSLGDWLDQFFITVTGADGWQRQVFHDRDGNGLLSAADLPLDGSFSLAGGDSIPLLLVIDVPPGQRDTSDVSIEFRATSLTDAAATAAARDVFAVRGSTPAFTLQKSVDRATAALGDTLTYAITFANGGNAGASGVELLDVLPRGLRYLVGSALVAGSASPAVSATDAITVTEDAGRHTVRAALGTVPAGASGTLTLRAILGADASDVVSNVASLRHGETEIASNAADTRLVHPHLTLSKRNMGAGSVPVGSELRYELSWSNAVGSGAVLNAVLTDTLAADLELVSAEGAHNVDGRVISWPIGTIAPGTSGSVLLVARVIARPSDGRLLNRAHLTATNAFASAEAGVILISEVQHASMDISKAASVLETSLGESITYTVVVRNDGSAPLYNLVVRDRMPAGTRFQNGRVSGADSLRVNDRDLTIWLNGVLQEGESLTLSYALTVVAAGRAGVLENVVLAEANDGRVRSDEATATVRVRGGFAMESRVIVGKVWFDADGDGRQGATEHGVGNVDIWSADGHVVTTDREGRFAFSNLGAGTHVLRIDLLGVPGGMGLAARGDETVRLRADGWTTPVVSFRLVNTPVASPSATGAPLQDETTAVQPALLQPARTAEERADEERQSFIGGPIVRIASPNDGTVVSTNRMYVGVRGEAGAEVRLFNGDSLIANSTLRPDGVADFVAVNLEEGTTLLRVAMSSTWGSERWDSVRVHRTGLPARIEAPRGPLMVSADGRSERLLQVRVVDAWGMPVAGAHVTFTPAGVSIGSQDADPSSVGLQLAAGVDGTIAVPLRGGRDVGAASVTISAASARAVVPVHVISELRPLIVTGGGEVGFGATARGSAAVAVRGTVGEATSVTLSYDSRRSGDVDDFFRRGQDIQDESRYPTLGDGSQSRSLTAPRQAIAARVERGMNWLELGDVQTAEFGNGALNSYRRSLTGVAGRVSTGVLTWTGYGSFTDQVLSRQQLRADGSSGPYRFGVDVRPGTERLAVEVRARDNAARVITRQDLQYGNDYQIDYSTGTVLLERPLPTSDGEGNPVFLTAMLERRTGGERRAVGGLGAELDLARMLRTAALDSLALTFGWARDAGTGDVTDAATISSTGFRASRSGLRMSGELLRAQIADAAAHAAEAEVEWSVADRLTLGAGWLRVADSFTAAADPRLRSGVEELRASAAVRVSSVTELRLRHERQRFAEQNIERERTSLQAVQRIGRRSVAAEAAISNDGQGDGTSTSAAVGKLSVAVSRQVDVWMETSQSLRSSSAGLADWRPAVSQLAGGATYRIRDGLNVELAHREVHRDSGNYGVSSLRFRGDRMLGGAAWTGIERAGGVQPSHAAVLGWKPQLALAGGWNVHAMFERRFGLGNAPLYDRARALPFVQREENRWTTAAGVQYMPSDSSLRVSARGELQGGAERRGYRWDVSADMPVSQSLALVTRHDWQASERMAEQWTEANRRERSLVGIAYRPAHNNSLNFLGKLEWRRDRGPLSGSTLGAGIGPSRLIGASDAVWTPAEATELAGRYAIRRSWSAVRGADGPAASMAHFIGARVEQRVVSSISFRADGRLLVTQGAGTSWAAAPSLLYELRNGLLAEVGYRYGALQDGDFGSSSGVFVTLGVRFSEKAAQRLADFWKSR
jgi:uncharacterized repeat protein (TIGR01451 family)